jgi:hypothetical protein
MGLFGGGGSSTPAPPPEPYEPPPEAAAADPEASKQARAIEVKNARLAAAEGGTTIKSRDNSVAKTRRGVGQDPAPSSGLTVG